MKKVLNRAVGQMECWLDDGIEKSMQLNGSVKQLNELNE